MSKYDDDLTLTTCRIKTIFQIYFLFSFEPKKERNCFCPSQKRFTSVGSIKAYLPGAPKLRAKAAMMHERAKAK